MTKKNFDVWSLFVIILTFILFVAALFVKGITHDILLESGVFLVSVKLIMLSHQNRKYLDKLNDRLEKVHLLIEQRKG